MASGQECVHSVLCGNETLNDRENMIDDPNAEPVLIGKIRIGQELRLKCYAKKVRRYFGLVAAIIHCVMEGHCKRTRQVVTVFRSLV